LIARRSSSLITSIFLVAILISIGWLLVAPGVFGGARATLDVPGAVDLPSAANTEVLASQSLSSNALLPGSRVVDAFQAAQPRDPFRPLILDIPDAGGTGDGTDPLAGANVTVVAITTDAAGNRRAIVRVDGTEYTVAVGETFAGRFKIVALDDDKVTFLFGDQTFVLGEGQQILK